MADVVVVVFVVVLADIVVCDLDDDANTTGRCSRHLRTRCDNKSLSIVYYCILVKQYESKKSTSQGDGTSQERVEEERVRSSTVVSNRLSIWMRKEKENV
jgi:hypothetical protein